MKKRKAVKQLKKMRKAGVRAWKKKKKKGKMVATHKTVSTNKLK